MIDVKCPRCGKLLFKAQSIHGPVEIKVNREMFTIDSLSGSIKYTCRHCNTPVTWPANQAEVHVSERKLIEE